MSKAISTANQPLYASSNETEGILSFRNSKKIPLFLPDEAIAHIFTRISRSQDYSSFARASKDLYKIGYSIPLYAFDPQLHRHILFHHLKLTQAGSKLIRAVGRLSFIDTEDVRFEVRSQLKLSEEAEFYSVFKRCCFQSDEQIESKTLAAYGQIIILYLEKKSKIFDSIDIVSRKVAQGLAKKVYDDMVHLFTSQPADSITMDSFKLKSEEMRSIFKNSTTIKIEASLRHALRLVHHKQFKVFSDNCTNMVTTGQIYQKIKAQLLASRKIEIEEELTKLQKEVLPAFLKVKNLEKELEIACAMQPEKPSFFGCMSFTLVDEFEEVKRAELFLREAISERNDLLTKVNDIADRDRDGHIVGGKLSPSDLLKIEAGTRHIIRRFGRFYTELCIKVTDANREERHLALRAILES